MSHEKFTSLYVKNSQGFGGSLADTLLSAIVWAYVFTSLWFNLSANLSAYTKQNLQFYDAYLNPNFSRSVWLGPEESRMFSPEGYRQIFGQFSLIFV